MGTANEKSLNLSSEKLWKLCQEGIPESHPRCFAYRAEELLKREFKLICKLGQVEEVLAAAEIRQFAWDHGIPCRLILAGCSSIMAQLLGLTDVNRIFLSLFFERFRHPQGRWAPRFYFQVPRDYQGAVLDFANECYGQEFVAEKFCFVDMSALAQIPYLVAHLVRQERRSDFTLKTIWKEMSFHPDKGVFQKLCAGDTEGIYMLEGMDLGLLQRLSPASIDGLTDFLTLSILTIDQSEVVEAYLRKDRAREFSGKIIRDISLVHGATDGLILYDEQIMLLFYLLYYKWIADGFDLIQAVRKNQLDKVAEYRNRFLDRAPRRCRLGKEEALRFFAQVEEAAVYVSCKATKAADAMTIYQAGYLKCHYPELFQRVLQKVREQKGR